MACKLPIGHNFLHIQYSISAISNDFGCVATFCTTESLSSAVISIVIPRSSLAFAAISLKADTPVPDCRNTMLLCAQIIGAPSVPAAAAVEAATPLLSSDLREILLLLFAFILISNLIYDIIVFLKFLHRCHSKLQKPFLR